MQLIAELAAGRVYICGFVLEANIAKWHYGVIWLNTYVIKVYITTA